MKSSALFLALLACSCHREGDENLGLLGARLDTAIDVRALPRVGELEKAFALPAVEVLKRLGPYRLSGATRFELVSSSHRDRTERFEETVRLEFDAQGSSRVVHETSRGEGFEHLAIGDRYFVRPRYGRFVGRAPEGDEVSKAEDVAQGLIGGYWAVLGRFASRSEAGEAVVNGRRVIQIKLAKAATPEPLGDNGEAHHRWRRTITVDRLEGEVAVDAKSGVPLEAHLAAQYQSLREKDGQRITVQLDARSRLEPGAAAPLVPPTDALGPLGRPRPLVDRQMLLEGLK